MAGPAGAQAPASTAFIDVHVLPMDSARARSSDLLVTLRRAIDVMVHGRRYGAAEPAALLRERARRYRSAVDPG